MIANRITINFLECDPSPSKGYKIKWRVLGSLDQYTDAGNFFVSPAVIVDNDNPPGTQYEGTIQSQGTNTNCNEIAWSTQVESQSSSSSGGGFDNSSCGSLISINTASHLYVDLGLFPINVDGAAHVDLSYDVLGRPNRFTLYDNGVFADTSGWKGIAPYPGNWGASLSTPLTGVLGFNPIAGHTYTLRIEVGPAGPPPYDISDNFQVSIICS